MIKMLVCDFDGTISGGEASLVVKFKSFIEQHRNLNFVVATGRTLPSISDGLTKGQYPVPTTIISDVGTQMHHGEVLGADHYWHSHVNQHWDRHRLSSLLSTVSYLGNQNAQHQGDYKLTFEGKLSKQQLTKLQALLVEHQMNVDITYSHDWFLDLTPKGINKATALTHLIKSCGLVPNQVLVAGDSANDSAMLTLPGVKSVLVANHYPEVAHLADLPQVYRAQHSHASGVIEGYHYWQQRN